MVFLDDADQPGAMAYYDLTPDGLPRSKGHLRLRERRSVHLQERQVKPDFRPGVEEKTICARSPPWTQERAAQEEEAEPCLGKRNLKKGT